MEFFSGLEVATWLDDIGFNKNQKALFATQVLGQVVVDVIVGCCSVSTIVRTRGSKRFLDRCLVGGWPKGNWILTHMAARCRGL